MPLLMRVRSEDLLQCRFAISPLNETTDALRSLARPGAGGLPPGLAAPGPAAAGPRPATSSRCWPSWRGPATSRISSTRPRTARSPRSAPSSTGCGRRRRSRWRRNLPEPRAWPGSHARGGDPAAVRDLLADMLRRAWSALIEPWWPRLRDVLDADITYRARRLADAGVAATSTSSTRSVSWQDGALRFAHRRHAGDRPVRYRDLVLIPSVFAWPGAAVSYDPPAVIYPARGIDGLWQPGSRSERRSRPAHRPDTGRLLTALAEPASTTGLAARTGIPVSSVSEHLAILRANGLVSTTRTGRYLIHQRTALGVALGSVNLWNGSIK